MVDHSINVQATWDDEAQVWVATSNDISGLAVEAETREALREKVVAAISDLIELNGIDNDAHEFPIHLMSQELLKVTNPCH